MDNALSPQQIAQNWVTWLDALASGRYKKARGTLHLNLVGVERHCCLGVAQICLGLDPTFTAVDDRLVELLGLQGSSGEFNNKSITYINDEIHADDDDFTNMHAELIKHVKEITHLHPEVAPLVHKLLAER